MLNTGQSSRLRSGGSVPSGALIGSIDQGTSSTRFSVYDCTTGDLKAFSSIQTRNVYPQEGWVEQDADEIYRNVLTVIEDAVRKLQELEIDASQIKGRHLLG